MDINLGKLQEMVKNREVWHAAVPGVRVGHDLVTEQWQNNNSCADSWGKDNVVKTQEHPIPVQPTGYV